MIAYPVLRCWACREDRPHRIAGSKRTCMACGLVREA